MNPINVGIVADPASPTTIARRMSDLHPPTGEDPNPWDIQIVSEPFTMDSEDVDTAIARLREHGRQQEWDLVIGLTELPLRADDGRYLLVETDPQQRIAVLSLPALGGLRIHARTRHAVRTLISGVVDSTSQNEHRVPLTHLSGRWRLLLGMCSPTVRGSSCPDSNPRSSRH